MQLKNKVFFITGGASGLGEGCARYFVKQGAKVLIADRNEKPAQALVSELGPVARFVLTDVTDEKSVMNALDICQKQLGGLNGVINCAGVAVADKIINKEGAVHPLAAFQKVIEVNLVGTFNVIRLAVDSMLKNPALQAAAPGTERGVIVNTASVAAFDGQIGQTAYAASKGGIVAMTLPLARELSRFGIRVMTIAPGIFDTPMLASLPEAARISLGQQVPFPARLGRAQDYAMLAAHIVENEMLNGEVIRLDGALRMAPK